MRVQGPHPPRTYSGACSQQLPFPCTAKIRTWGKKVCPWILAHHGALGTKRSSKFSPSSPLYQQFLSYLRYHKSSQGVFNPISEPCSLLSEEKGAPKPSSSSLDAATKARPGRVGSTHCEEAQCSSGKSTCKERDLDHSALNQKHLNGCSPLWLLQWA